MNERNEPLARHLRPALDEARLARQLSAIESRMRPRRVVPSQITWIALASAAAVVVATGGALSHREWEKRHAARPAPASSDMEIEYVTLPDEPEIAAQGRAVDPGDVPTTLKLPDGSTATFGAQSRASLREASASSVRIDLERGDVEVEATHVEGRRFVVAAAGREVRVVGTHFTVRVRDGGAVEVSVARGKVEVASLDGSTRAVGEGERWSVDPAIAASGSTRASGSVAAPTSNARDATSLFEAAQKARREGRSFDAAKAYDELRRSFRSDARAGVAAFELGRLRLDALGDAKGADEALRDAIALAPSASYRVDAEARRVEALDRMGGGAACIAARDRYVKAYPTSVYRKRVEGYCSRP
jgi:transmembrane sensor